MRPRRLYLPLLLLALLLVAAALLSARSQASAPPVSAAVPAAVTSATATPVCGSWSIVPSTTSTNTLLFSVSAVSANDVWAAGFRGPGPAQSFTMRWNGQAWNEVPSPNVPGGSNEIYAIDAVSATDAWAVGLYYVLGQATSRMIIMHWNGVQWTIVPSLPNEDRGVLYGVAAYSASDVWAVGRYRDAQGRSLTLILHWDGTQWTQVPSPNPPPSDKSTGRGSGVASKRFGTLWEGDSILTGVTAVSPNNVWAVGQHLNNGYRALTLHWDGSQWSIMPNGSGGVDESGTLWDVSASSGSDVWAIGTRYTAGGERPLAMRWNGSQWNTISTPDIQVAHAYDWPIDIEAIALNDAWIAGTRYDGGVPTGALLMHWNGNAWSVTADPVPGGGLTSVSAVSSTDVWAIGENGGTLTLHYPGSCAVTETPTATPVCGPWSVYAAPNLTGTAGYLFDVSGSATNDVWAAGTRSFNPDDPTLTLHWNGTQWVDVPSPSIPNASTDLFAVEAISPTMAWAVGLYEFTQSYGGMVIMRWDGAQWSIVPNLPLESQGRLFGLGASSASDVWAVGELRSSSGPRPLTLHWDGQAWSVVQTPNPLGAGADKPADLRDRDGRVLSDGDTQLFSAAATSANDAWAVGYYISGGQRRVLTMHWNGTEWSIVPNPGMGHLWEVTALSENDVWAAGITGGPTYRLLVMHWDGVQWSIAPTPDVPLGAYEWEQSGIAAAASDDVWAVSTRHGGTLAEPAIMHWNGSTWSVDPGPGPQQYGSELGAVEAISGGDVWAVGFGTTIYRYTNPCITPTITPSPTVTHTPMATLTVTHTRTPTLTRTPSATGTPQCPPSWAVVPGGSVASSELHAVEVIAEDDIWAVGSRPGTGSEINSLTMHWDGSQWSIAESPDPMPENILRGVTAVAPDDVWAVGYSRDPGTNLFWTLILHWDGTQWSEMPNPVPGGMLAVDAVSTNDVWAVGNPVMHWDGTQWSVVTTPQLESYFLTGVSAVAANDVWAVGFQGSSQAAQTLVEHWNGTQWSVVSSPNVGTEYNQLRAVSAVSANDIWAAGYSRSAGSPDQTLTMRWNGAQWTVVPSPNITTTYNNLWGLEAISSDDVWAVGLRGGGQTLLMHWNGAAWSLSNSSFTGELYGVAAAAWNDVTVVGRTPAQSLVLRYSANCATATPTGSATATRTRTATPSSTVVPPTGSATATRTRTATATRTGTATTLTNTPAPTLTPCGITFSDVLPTDYFYEPVRYLFCMGAISGYSDNTFRPYNNTTRGQLTKIVVLAERWQLLDPATPTFSDVPTSHPFFVYVETAYSHGIISGYADGTFQPGNNITRGQLCKIIVLAEQWAINTAGGPHFSDVPEAHPFYGYVETAFNRDIITGYAGGTFRPGNPATRGQISKIVYNALLSP